MSSFSSSLTATISLSSPVSLSLIKRSFPSSSAAVSAVSAACAAAVVAAGLLVMVVVFVDSLIASCSLTATNLAWPPRQPRQESRRRSLAPQRFLRLHALRINSKIPAQCRGDFCRRRSSQCPTVLGEGNLGDDWKLADIVCG